MAKNNTQIVSKLERRAVKKYGFIFLLPTVAAFCIGFVWPFFRGVYLSFFRFKTLRNTTFIGIKNYVSALKDESFLRSFGFTCLFIGNIY